MSRGLWRRIVDTVTMWLVRYRIWYREEQARQAERRAWYKTFSVQPY